ncbi:MAG: deoxyribose-phosphate aldolase [Oscillospiraceae bacterium]|nr:deoxyribose-phosphate aldolase [Oscillospiraceae bacterium]
MTLTREELAKRIDHTLLRPEATPADIDALCREAALLGTASVCVNALYVPRCRAALAGSEVLVCAVAGFPLGACGSGAKAYEAAKAVEAGADEVDMVLPVGLLISGDYSAVLGDIAAVVAAAGGKTVKVILETCLLTSEQIARGCKLSEEAGAHFVKTSTGFAAEGATEENVRLMRKACSLPVKAAGGIRTATRALAMLQAGASRLGASKTAEILREIG